MVEEEQNNISSIVEQEVLPVRAIPQGIGLCSGELDTGGPGETISDITEFIDCSGTTTPTCRTESSLLSTDNRSYISNRERFQAEVTKWEEFYDQMHKYLLDDLNGTPGKKTVPKQASNFSIGQDGSIYYSKLNKNGSLLSLKVIRSHEERASICRDIHVSTGNDSLHHRRDKMLEILGLTYYWKGQRRDVCQCIASCEICSSGLGAKRKSKPPGQKRDIPRIGPPEPPRKRGRKKFNDPFYDNSSSISKSLNANDQPNTLLGSDSVLTSELAIASAITQMVGDVSQQHNNDRSSFPKDQTFSINSSNTNCSDQFISTPGRQSDGINLHQIFTTIEDETSNQLQNSPRSILQESSSSDGRVAENEIPGESEVSIYELLFKLPSVPSSISPSVMEAVHMAMKHTPNEINLSEACEAIMRQILSLEQGYNIIISPTSASAYTIAVSASMLKMDPLSVSRQISSQFSSPLAVIHDSCCAEASNLETGPIKTTTALTGAYNWNLGGIMYPMDRDMLRMAVQSNRVAAVFYQPYAYNERTQHISLEVLSSICHSRGSDVSVIVDATIMPTHHINLKKLVAETKSFFQQGADLVLLPSVNKLHGQSYSSVLVGISSLLSKVWRSIVLLQKHVCLPLLCLPHDLVGTVVAYKALQE